MPRALPGLRWGYSPETLRQVSVFLTHLLSGWIGEDLLSEIGSPMIPEETYAAIVNRGV